MRARIALRQFAARGSGLAPLVAMHINVMNALRDADTAAAVEALTTILHAVCSAFD